jgi:hypothetical protein
MTVVIIDQLLNAKTIIENFLCPLRNKKKCVNKERRRKSRTMEIILYELKASGSKKGS